MLLNTISFFNLIIYNRFLALVIQELNEHFIRKSEQEVEKLRFENSQLKNLVETLRNSLALKSETENEEILTKQIITLQVRFHDCC